MPICRDDPGGEAVLLAVKAVPGAKRDEVVGRLGDRLKVRVSAAPEGGKANLAICDLLARQLNLKPAAVSIARGASHPEKIVRLQGITAAEVERIWP